MLRKTGRTAAPRRQKRSLCGSRPATGSSHAVFGAQRESVPFTRERSKVRSLVRPPLPIFIQILDCLAPLPCAPERLGHTRKKTGLKPFPPRSPALCAPKGRFHGGHNTGTQNLVNQLWPTVAAYGAHSYYRWLCWPSANSHPMVHEILWGGAVQEPPLVTPEFCADRTDQSSGGSLGLPSEGKGHTFESCRVRQFLLTLQRDMRVLTKTPTLSHSSE